MISGEILIIETPYSSILLPEYYGTHCQSCFIRILAPIPCWFCCKVRFCSDICRLEAWERFHKVECQQLDLILDSTLGKMAMLAMRILTSSGKIYLDYIISKLEEEADARKDQPDATRKLAFNEEDIYDSAGEKHNATILFHRHPILHKCILVLKNCLYYHYRLSNNLFSRHQL